MKRLADIPHSRPAATKHSPNRKDRTGGRLDLMRAFAARQEAIINLFITGYSEAQIVKKLKLPPTSIPNARHDPEFRTRMDNAIEFAKAETRGYGAALLPMSMQVAEATIKGKNKSPLRYKAASDNLRGMQVWNAEQGMAISQPPIQDNRSLIINVLTSGDPKIRDLALSLARALEAGTGERSGEAESGRMAESKAS